MHPKLPQLKLTRGAHGQAGPACHIRGSTHKFFPSPSSRRRAGGENRRGLAGRLPATDGDGAARKRHGGEVLPWPPTAGPVDVRGLLATRAGLTAAALLRRPRGGAAQRTSGSGVARPVPREAEGGVNEEKGTWGSKSAGDSELCSACNGGARRPCLAQARRASRAVRMTSEGASGQLGISLSRVRRQGRVSAMVERGLCMNATSGRASPLETFYRTRGGRW
jgi:hypothetical protein